MKTSFDLKGKVAMVTGGNGGIGEGIARGLASVGCGIGVAARNASKTDQAVRRMQKDFKVPVKGFQIDVREEKSIISTVKKILDEFGRIDILVNNAGTNIRKFPQDVTVEDWDEVLNTNLRSALLCSKAVYPAMKKQGGGKIINIGSMTSLFGGAKLSQYGSSKGGIVQLARALATAWAPDNIQVNSILPGWINTELTARARVELEGLNERVLARTPAGRWGEPDDLAGAAVFLSSPASDFVTGVALPVDGGFSISI